MLPSPVAWPCDSPWEPAPFGPPQGYAQAGPIPKLPRAAHACAPWRAPPRALSRPGGRAPARIRKSSMPSRTVSSNSHMYCRTASAVPWNHALLTGLWLAASTCAGAGAWSGARGAAGAPRFAHQRPIASPRQVRLRPLVDGRRPAAAPGATGACADTCRRTHAPGCLLALWLERTQQRALHSTRAKGSLWRGPMPAEAPAACWTRACSVPRGVPCARPAPLRSRGSSSRPHSRCRPATGAG